MGLFVKTPGGLVPDSLEDDLSLAIRTDPGLVVILGCAHRGPINIIRHLRDVSGEDRVYAVVGGTHLLRASDERIHKTINQLKQWGVRQVACSHCTGFRAAAMMSMAFGDGFVYNNAGVELNLA